MLQQSRDTSKRNRAFILKTYLLFFEEQPVVFEGFRGGMKYWGKYSKIMFFRLFKKETGLCQSWLMSCSFTRLISSYKDDDRHFIKMFFFFLTDNYWDKSNLEAQFLGWDRNESLTLFLQLGSYFLHLPIFMCLLSIYNATGRGGRTFLSFVL